MNKSEASKLRIGKTPEERSKRMAEIARIKWQKMSIDERKNLIRKMVNKKKKNG